MTMKKILTGLCIAMLAIGSLPAWAGGAHRIGGGANYWTSVEDIDDSDVDEDGFSYLVSYQYRPGLLGLGIDAEMMPDRYGEDTYAPQAYLILGKGLYAAAGVGILLVDDEWAEDPFYSLRAGIDLELLPSIYLDINANYRFNETTDLEASTTDIDTDTVFLGAAVRLGF